MLRRLFLLSLFVFLVGNVSFANSIYTKEQIDRFSKVQYKIVNHGEHYTAVNSGLVPDYKVANTNYEVQGDWWSNVTEVAMSNLRNYYDLESNGTPVQIWQDPSNPDNIHAVYTYSAQESGWSDRTIQYFYSSDRGVTWSFIGNVPASGRAGFGTITGLSSGVALIGSHTNAGASTNVRFQLYVDAFPGLGSFTNLDPAGDANKYIWGRIIGTTNTTLANKYVFATSTSGADSAFWNTGTSLSSSSFLGYKPFLGSPAEGYCLGRADNGNIGLAYIADDARIPADVGDVFFMESTNNGTSFGTPTKIFDSQLPSGDSLGALRGISMVYKGNAPCVVFEIIKQTTAGNFFPGAPNKIMFWSSAVNGGSPVKIADSSNVPYAPYQGTNDVLAPLSRPSIGKSADGNTLFVSMMVASSSTGSTDTTSFGDIYLTASGNGGASWKRPLRVNGTSPRFDYRYANISPSNNVTGGATVNMVVQKDVVPGSNVNLANPLTDAKPVYWKVTYNPPIGINEISSVAKDFGLQQNFPNPFNPSTSIRFSLPQLSNVTLKVYALNGQEVATVINNQLVGAGVQEVSFNASNLSSGIYFYTLTAGNYKETKKMMLVK